MAAERATASSFGTVSRTAGVVFRYVLLAATLAGVVSLGVLLAYVANDAFRPFTADLEWYLTYGATLAGPTLGLALYLYWSNPRALVTGVLLLGLLLVALLFAGGIAAVFIDVLPPLVWFAYLTAVLVPVGVIVILSAIDRSLPFYLRVLLVGTIGVLSVVGIPPIGPGVPGIYSLAEQILRLPYVPADWLILTVSLGGPAAFLAGRYGRRWSDRAGTVVGVGALLTVLTAAFVGPVGGLDPIPATVVTAVALVPAGTYALVIGVERPDERLAIVLPIVVIAGTLLGLFVVDFLNVAGPQAWLDWGFVTGTDQASLGSPEEAGIYPAIVGTILLMVVVTVLSFPLGVGAAVYLEEYAPDNRFTHFVDVNISNLAGVPSVVYGLLGLGVFVRYGGMTPGTVFVGGATLSLLILPIVIIASREAIRAVPDSTREASYGMGATRWQTVRSVVLPEAFPGILTGVILALGRAIGETAPLLVIGAPQIFGLPASLDSPVGAMPLQLYVWATTFASEAFWTTALAAGVVTLLAAMLTMNSVAIVLRNRYQRDGPS